VVKYLKSLYKYKKIKTLTFAYLSPAKGDLQM